MAYGDEKDFEGKEYRGMKVGGKHLWTYPDGKWTESKVSPQRWEVAFTSLKQRRRRAPANSGAEVGSGYHWLIVAHQWVGKLDANTYATHLEGSKHLLSFRKPGWRGWTTQQKGHTSARDRTILALEGLIAELRAMPDGAFEDPKDAGALTSLLAAQSTATAGTGSAMDGSVATADALAGPGDAASRTRRKSASKRNGSRPKRVKRERRRTVAATPTRPRSRR